jgi:hypothetical protein
MQEDLILVCSDDPRILQTTEGHLITTQQKQKLIGLKKNNMKISFRHKVQRILYKVMDAYKHSMRLSFHDWPSKACGLQYRSNNRNGASPFVDFNLLPSKT